MVGGMLVDSSTGVDPELLGMSGSGASKRDSGGVELSCSGPRIL